MKRRSCRPDSLSTSPTTVPPEEVWRAPAGVRVWNRYFELFELERVTVVVTESAALTPLEIEKLRKGIVLPPGLRAWSDSRVRRTPDV